MTTLLDFHSDIHHSVVISVISLLLDVVSSFSARTVTHHCSLQCTKLVCIGEVAWLKAKHHPLGNDDHSVTNQATAVVPIQVLSVQLSGQWCQAIQRDTSQSQTKCSFELRLFQWKRRSAQ